jgi:hypothetical protein
MSRSSGWRILAVTGMAIAALAACGGTPAESPTSSWEPAAGGDDAIFTALGNGPGNGGVETPAGPGDGTCHGTGPGDGICVGTGLGPGPHGDGSGSGRGPGNGACDGTGAGPGNGTCQGTCDGAGPGDGTCVVGTDPEDLEALLIEALQEEYLAETTYRRVVADFGPVAPFARIAESEAQHVLALLGLFERRALEAPASVWTPENVSTFPSIPTACAGAVATEIEDGALYEGYLSRDDLPSDVVNVFTHLQAASLENHLPAFQSCQ